VNISSMPKVAAGESAKNWLTALSMASRPPCRVPSGEVASSKTQSSVTQPAPASMS